MNKTELTADNVDNAPSNISHTINESQIDESDDDSEFDLGTRIKFGIAASLFLVMTIIINWNGFDAFAFGMIGVLSLIVVACLTQNRIGRFAGGVVALMIISMFLFNLYSQFPLPEPLFNLKNGFALFMDVMLVVWLGLPALRYILRTKFGFGAIKKNKKALERVTTNEVSQ